MRGFLGDYADNPDLYAAFFAGNDYSSSTNPIPYTDPTGAYAMEYAGAASNSLIAAQNSVVAAAGSGSPVPQYTVDTLAAQGINLNSIAGAAGAIFALTRQANGQYISTPQNAIAQQQAAAKASQTKMILMGAAALAAFILLRH